MSGRERQRTLEDLETCPIQSHLRKMKRYKFQKMKTSSSRKRFASFPSCYTWVALAVWAWHWPCITSLFGIRVCHPYRISSTHIIVDKTIDDGHPPPIIIDRQASGTQNSQLGSEPQPVVYKVGGRTITPTPAPTTTTITTCHIFAYP